MPHNQEWQSQEWQSRDFKPGPYYPHLWRYCDPSWDPSYPLKKPSEKWRALPEEMAALTSQVGT